MRFPLQALAWEIWAAHRAGFTALLLAVPCCAALYRAHAAAVQTSGPIRTLSFLPMALSFLLLFRFFSFAEARGERSGFPARLFVLPARTLLLIACPVAGGVAAVVLLYAAWACCVYLPLGIPLPFWPAWLLAAALVCWQALVWGLAGLRTARLVALGMTGTGFVSAALWLAPGTADGIAAPIREAVSGAVAACAALAGAGAWAGVDRQRRGGWHVRSRPLALLRRAALPLLRRVSAADRAFASPEAAQLWLEWRRGGMVLPACVAGTLLVIAGPITLLADMDRDLTPRALAAMLLAPLALAAALGPGCGRPDFWSGGLSLPAFAATRPITCEQMIAAKLRAAALGALAAWTIVLAAAPVWLFTAATPDSVVEGWQRFWALYAPAWRPAVALLIAAGAVTVTWALLVSGVTAAALGRSGPFYAFAAATAAGWAILLLACFDPFAGKSLALERGARMLPAALRSAPALLFCLLTLKAWMAAGMLIRAARRGDLRAGSSRRLLLAWAATAALWCALPAALLPASRLVPGAFLLPFLGDWLMPAAWLALPLALPLVRLAAAPEALSRNRHRRARRRGEAR